MEVKILPSKLYHYSKEEIKELRQDFHEPQIDAWGFCMKPYGLWVSVEDYEDDVNWKQWSLSEEFRLEHLKYRYSVNIVKKSNILFLNSSEELTIFSLEYESPQVNHKYEYLKYIYSIDWERVMTEYDGIIIAPYIWSCRLDNPATSWYYGWDCASGCIWNIDAIEIKECQEEENAKD